MKFTTNSICEAQIRIKHQFPHRDGVEILATTGMGLTTPEWPVAINIAADRIEVSVWAGRYEKAVPSSLLGWTLKEGEEAHSGNVNAYEFVGVKDYRGENWIGFHQLANDCPTITARRQLRFYTRRMEILNTPFEISRWSEGMGLNNGHHTAYDEDGVREDMRQRMQAYQILIPLVDDLTNPKSDLVAAADKIAHAVLMESERADYENDSDKSNRPMVMDDCFGEIQRANKCLWDTKILKMATTPVYMPVFKVTDKQQVALDAAIYGVAMGEDYSKAGDGWSDIMRNGRRFSPKDVEEYYTHAAEFNTRHGGGVLVNMWNALSNHADHVAIADYADAMIAAVDMKTVHDESEAKWFMLQAETDAHAENTKADGKAIRLSGGAAYGYYEPDYDFNGPLEL
jgi:hypothetical protein